MTGKRCDERLEGWCDKSMCNGGECVVGDNNNNNGGDGNDFKCICPQDTTGEWFFCYCFRYYFYYYYYFYYF